MKRHALQILSDDGNAFRWVLLEPAEAALVFQSHSHSECGFDDYQSALDAGTVALAAADAQPYENEAGDPVGSAAGGAIADVPPT